MTPTYRLSMKHDFIITTNDLDEVRKNYQFPDFSDCNSIVGEAEFEAGTDTWTKVSPCDCDQCECVNTDDYTESGWTCEDCFRDCLETEGGE
jgi:hypothetical protein